VVAAGALVGYAAAMVVWSQARVGWSFTLPVYVAAAVPPSAYALFIVLSSPSVRAPSLILADGALCLPHVGLSFLTASLLVATSGLAYETALTRAFFEFPLALLPPLIFGPLVLAPFRGLLVPPLRLAGAPASVRAQAPHGAQPNPVLPVAVVSRAAPVATPASAVTASRSVEHAADPVAIEDRRRPAATRPDVSPKATVPPVAPVEREDVVRISFDRVADQLPTDTFRLSKAQLAASLFEPGHLLIPRRLVLPQLAEGVVDVPWSAVANQFPRQTLSLSDADIARRISHGRLRLPIDEVVRQLPREAFSLSSPPPDLLRLAQFTAPFAPDSPLAPSAAPPGGPMPASMSAPLAVQPSSAVGRPSEAVTSRAVEESVATRSVPTGPMKIGADRWAAVDPAKLAALFEPLGVLEVHAEVIGDLTLLAVTAPGVPLAASLKTAAHLVPLLTAGAGSIDQATLRGSDGAVVITPLASMSGARRALVTLVRRTASLALLEILSRRAAAALGLSPEARVVEPSISDQRPRASLTLIEEGADVQDDFPNGSFSAFGPGEVSRFRSGGDGVRLYVFRPSSMAARPLAQYAWDVYQAVDLADATGDSPRYSSIVLKREARWTVIRSFPAPRTGHPMLLIATGEVSRPGLAHRQVERMAERLRSL